MKTHYLFCAALLAGSIAHPVFADDMTQGAKPPAAAPIEAQVKVGEQIQEKTKEIAAAAAIVEQKGTTQMGQTAAKMGEVADKGAAAIKEATDKKASFGGMKGMVKGQKTGLTKSTKRATPLGMKKITGEDMTTPRVDRMVADSATEMLNQRNLQATSHSMMGMPGTMGTTGMETGDRINR